MEMPYELPNSYCHYCGCKLVEDVNRDAECPRENCKFNTAIADAMQKHIDKNKVDK